MEGGAWLEPRFWSSVVGLCDAVDGECFSPGGVILAQISTIYTTPTEKSHEHASLPATTTTTTTAMAVITIMTATDC